MNQQPRHMDGKFGHSHRDEANNSLSSSNSWPEAEYDEVTWEGGAQDFNDLRFMSGMRGQNYEAFVPPTIAETGYAPSPQIASLAEEASREISRFDEKYGARVGPFATIMLRSESVASSQIENLTANARSLGEAELGIEEELNATLVVRNVRAMESALAASENLDTGSILDMHRALMKGTRDEATAGSWRQQQVWIGTSSSSPIGAEFIPPHHDRVPALMEDLMVYARRTDVPTMAQAAIAHAQFETVHPFTDGNGRIGRALIHSMLKRHGVARNVSTPVSAGLLADIGAYHRSLDAYRAGNPEPIITLCSEASFRAIWNGTQLAEDVTSIADSWKAKIKARKDAAVWRVLELLESRPVVNAAVLEAELGLDYLRSKRAMDLLTENGVVIGVDKYKRGRFWRAPEMLNALDAFAERAGRRRQSGSV
ncbi:cell filamentation protein Fic [Arthrobacter sp. MYb211]|uniref:Fic family protein n=1 Tax=unclassified Arthrobacter TaxID=235627 RepID=UPI000CFD0D40|nr:MULTISPECIES: Fic family protein [unclassified Arthrobacter]PRA14150.1 cell filamentation protein Fic [Arthrobacter sp. MYb221]PRC06656.1 cell filamentation protein Fic [Arthrobacter sp. MYb211]